VVSVRTKWFDEVPSHISMDMAVEKRVFDSFMSTLMMCEHAPPEQEVTIVLTLGELRQHVQFCQYAGKLADGAHDAQKAFQRQHQRMLQAERLISDWQKQEAQLTTINGKLANLKDATTEFFRLRADHQKRLKQHATSND
jgi:hypothetical protein